MGKRKPNDKLIIEALLKTGGNITATANSLKCTRQAIYNWVNANPKLKEIRQQAEESMIDIAEGMLFKAVNKGDMTAIIFTLKTKGKSRGYVEKQEIQIDKESVINVGYVKESTGE